MKQKHILGWVLFVLSALSFVAAVLTQEDGNNVSPAFSVLGVFFLVGSFVAAVNWSEF